MPKFLVGDIVIVTEDCFSLGQISLRTLKPTLRIQRGCVGRVIDWEGKGSLTHDGTEYTFVHLFKEERTSFVLTSCLALCRNKCDECHDRFLCYTASRP